MPIRTKTVYCQGFIKPPNTKIPTKVISDNLRRYLQLYIAKVLRNIRRGPTDATCAHTKFVTMKLSYGVKEPVTVAPLPKRVVGPRAFEWTSLSFSVTRWRVLSNDLLEGPSSMEKKKVKRSSERTTVEGRG
jgi:hypothetical protein